MKHADYSKVFAAWTRRALAMQPFDLMTGVNIGEKEQHITEYMFGTATVFHPFPYEPNFRKAIF